MPTSKDFSVEDEAYLSAIAAEPKMTMDEVGADIDEHGHVPVTPETATQDPFTAKGSLANALDEAISAETDFEHTTLTRDKNDNLDSHLTNPTDDFRDETKGEVEGTTSTPQGLIQPVESNKVGEGLEPTIQQDKAVQVKDSLAEALDAITMDGAEEIEAKPPIGKDPEPDLSKYDEENASHIPLKAPNIPPSMGGDEDKPDANGLVYVSATFTVDPDKYVSNNYRPTNMGKAPDAASVLKQKSAAMQSQTSTPEDEEAISDLGTPESREAAASPDEPTEQQEKDAAKDADKEQKKELDAEAEAEAKQVIPSTKEDDKQTQDEAPENVVLDYATFIDGSSFICFDEVSDIDYSKIAMDAGPKKAPTRANCQTTFAQCRAKNPLFCRFHGPKLLEADIKTAIKATVGPGCVVQVTKDKNSKNKFTFRLTVGCPPSKKKMVEKMVHMYLTQNPGITSSTEDWNLVGKHKQTQEFEMDILQADNPPKKDTKADQMLSNTKKAIKEHKKQDVVGETAPGVEKKAAKGEKWQTVDEDVENEWADLVDKTVHKSLLGNNEEFLANFNNIANQFDQAHDAGDAAGLKQALESLKEEIGKYDENGEKKPEAATEKATSPEVPQEQAQAPQATEPEAKTQAPEKSIYGKPPKFKGANVDMSGDDEAEFDKLVNEAEGKGLFNNDDFQKKYQQIFFDGQTDMAAKVAAMKGLMADASSVSKTSPESDGTTVDRKVTKEDILDFFGNKTMGKADLKKWLELANNGTFEGGSPTEYFDAPSPAYKNVGEGLQKIMEMKGADHPMTKALVKAGLQLPEGMEGAESGESEEVVLPAPPVLSKGNDGAESNPLQDLMDEANEKNLFGDPDFASDYDKIFKKNVNSYPSLGDKIEAFKKLIADYSPKPKGAESTQPAEEADAKKNAAFDKVKKALAGTGYENADLSYEDFGDTQEVYIATSENGEGTLEAAIGKDGGLTFGVHDNNGFWGNSDDPSHAISDFEKNYGGKPPVPSYGGKAHELATKLSGFKKQFQSIVDGGADPSTVDAMNNAIAGAQITYDKLAEQYDAIDEIDKKIQNVENTDGIGVMEKAFELDCLNMSKKEAEGQVSLLLNNLESKVSGIEMSFGKVAKSAADKQKGQLADDVEQQVVSVAKTIFPNGPVEGVDSAKDMVDSLFDETSSELAKLVGEDNVGVLSQKHGTGKLADEVEAQAKKFDDAIQEFKDAMDTNDIEGAKSKAQEIKGIAGMLMGSFGFLKGKLGMIKAEAEEMAKVNKAKERLAKGNVGQSQVGGKKPVEPFDFDAWQKGQQASGGGYEKAIGEVVRFDKMISSLNLPGIKDAGSKLFTEIPSSATSPTDLKVGYHGKYSLSKVIRLMNNGLAGSGYQVEENPNKENNIKVVKSEQPNLKNANHPLTDEEKKAKIAAMSPKQKMSVAIQYLKKQIASNPSNKSELEEKLKKAEALFAKL